MAGALPRFADRLTLGKGLAVSPFCLGGVGDWRLIPLAFDMGINFFYVSCDMHWPLYKASRQGLADLLARPGVRDQIAVAGVVYPTQPEFCVAPFQELVEEVPGLARIDVRVAGGSYGPDLLPRLDVLRAAPDARAVGASFHDRRAALMAANHRLVDLGYVRYNPVHPGARRDLFPELVDDHAPLYNFKSMVGYVPPADFAKLDVDPRLWLPDAPDYYRYALSRTEGLLFAVNRPSDLEELAAGLGRGALSPGEEDHMEELAILTHSPRAAAAGIRPY